jgi:hypothetical protein
MIEIFSEVKLSITLYYEKSIFFCEPSGKQNVLFYGSNDAASNIDNGGTNMNGYFSQL